LLEIFLEFDEQLWKWAIPLEPQQETIVRPREFDARF